MDSSEVVGGIAPETAMGVVTLHVADIDTMSAYYASAFLMEVMDEKVRGSHVVHVLGRGGTPLIRLVSAKDLPVGSHHSAGLYHTAFLFESPQTLATTVYRAAQNPLSRFVGSSDHTVSEAFYFTDPEGNGVELYADRPRSMWPIVDGKVAMDTQWLDPNNYLEQHLLGWRMWPSRYLTSKA
ncbi:hypothetical protein FYJ24_06135 [Actinomycetaceae bacterium WB03_NA08]|uniref:VOC domain-containing protein n=1 Tax=Scrofimicrobium canadense TaxID=2652290 RepID=A0A6N7W883_9ACTO|nr:VOC family protein [Scrofimicrobium canadense]MSS84348.1 hypothetical protein [Scrofimicrobium canadense]